jgi:hypothetical protein
VRCLARVDPCTPSSYPTFAIPSGKLLRSPLQSRHKLTKSSLSIKSSTLLNRCYRMADLTSKRRACHGSCHCGLTEYIVFLDLPHPFSSSNPPKSTDTEIYRCNCSTCHKMGFLHVNPANPRADFMLLSPLDPDQGLSTYQCFSGNNKWYFCPKCGVRCFAFGGVGETNIIDVPELGESKGAMRKVWQAVWDGREETTPYLSVNGITMDYREDFDLRVLTEGKQVHYLDDRSEPAEKKLAPRWDRPHHGGCY